MPTGNDADAIIGGVAPLRILVSTNNAHKLAEFQRLLAAAPVELVAPADAGIALDVDETGTSFVANAVLKARAFAAAAGMLALADDSGIEVDALDGAPGVLSARYGGPGLDDAGRTQRLLDELRQTPDAERRCRYIAVLALAWPNGPTETFAGHCDGLVARKPAGGNGFGYDPVFFVPGAGRTMAELSPGEKDALSHRGLASVALMARLAVLASTEREALE